MKTFPIGFLITVLALLCSCAKPPTENAANVVAAYAHALSNQKPEDLAALFVDSGVAQIQGSSTSVGRAEIGDQFRRLFQNITLDLRFEIEEIMPLSDEWVLVRTISHGSATIRANGANVPSGGHEMFLLRKQTDGTWRISHYAASSNK